MVALTLREFTTWLDVTVFELWIHFTTTIISSILLCLKLLDIVNISYHWVASPIFIGIAFVYYFIFIIFMRSCVEYKDYRGPTLKVIFNMIRLSLITSFLYLLINKISGELEKSEVANQNTYVFIFTPIWVLLFIWAVQICRTTNNI